MVKRLETHVLHVLIGRVGNLLPDRRLDLLEEEAIGVDQEVVVRPRHAGRDVREDEVVPAS